MRRTNIVLIAVLVATVLCSCASTAQKKTDKTVVQQGDLKSIVLAGDFANAKAKIEESRETYSDELLYLLDSGWIAYYNGSYKEAVNILLEAERIAEERKAKSFTDDLSKSFDSDKATDYVAENYEDVYINLCLALCYYQLGEKDEAFVEVRKVNTKLADMSLNEKNQTTKFQDFVLKITPNALNAYENEKKEKAREYTTSSFASYLSMLFYRSENDGDNARIDADKLVSEFGFTADEEDIINVKDKARVNFISLEGCISDKKEVSVTVPTLFPPIPYRTGPIDGGEYLHKVAWPKIEGSNGIISSVRISCSNGQNANMSEIENVNDVASCAVAFKSPDTYLRSFYRGYLKVSAAVSSAKIAYEEASEAAEKISNQMAKKAAKIAAEKTKNLAIAKMSEEAAKSESADLRMASFMPGSVKVAGMTLEPGVYDFTVEYTRDGSTIVNEFKQVEVKAGELNLIFSNCIR